MKNKFLLLIVMLTHLASCNSENQDQHQSKINTDAVLDPSGKSYSTIELNGQLWLRENLNFELSNSYCYGLNEENCINYGRLYNWAAAREACAQLGSGWHLPTDEEWKGLAMSLGGYFNTNRMQSQGNSRQSFAALIKGGSTGFDALLGGKGNGDSAKDFEELKRRGSYWSATEAGTTKEGLAENLVVIYAFSTSGRDNDQGGLFSRDFQGKQKAISCRCVKDK